MDMEELVKKQRDFFLTGATLPYAARRDWLRTLGYALERYEEKLKEALHEDLHKAGMESYMAEIALTKAELKYCLRHLKGWMQHKRVKSSLANFHSKAFTVAEPYGVALIMAPWNYPVMLCLEPLINALAAGNCVILKPSAYAPATSAVLAEMMATSLPPQLVTVVEGGRDENAALLEQRFDYIFFTGGVTVGRLVLEKAARYMTPVTLELGGKSPCIVDATADVRLAARRIIFGKLLNAGQTCVAPDYLLVEHSVKEQLLKALQREITLRLGSEPLDNEEYPKIVNQKHFRRIMNLIEGEKVVCGGCGREETLQIAPTLLDEVTLQSPVMQEEIFGPVLPVLTYQGRDELLGILRHFEKPLACYLFTGNQVMEQWLLANFSFGGGCINDTIVHLATSEMAFGGVGYSGMGGYHGRVGFETFSHRKSVLKKYNWLDVPVRYHPYSRWKEKIIRLLLS